MQLLPKLDIRQRAAGERKKMDTKLFYKIIDELAALRWLGQIQPSYYNEPLLDERLPELLAYAKSKLPLCLFRVITNGDLLTVDMYKKLVKDGVNEFVVSQHQKEETKTISTLKEYRENHGADGVNVIYKTLGSITSRGGLVEVKGNWSLQEKCTYPLWNVIVDYSGELVFCCEDYLSTVKLGNVNSGTLMQIWNSAYYRKLRKEIDQGIFNVEICNKCVGGRNPASA